MPSGKEKKRLKRAQKRNRNSKKKTKQNLPTYVVAFGIQEVRDDPKTNNEAGASIDETPQSPNSAVSPEISNFTSSDASVATLREVPKLSESENSSYKQNEKFDLETNENSNNNEQSQDNNTIQTDSIVNVEFGNQGKTILTEFLKQYTGPEQQIFLDGHKRKKARKLTSKSTKQSKVLFDKHIRNINFKNHQNRIKRQIKLFFGGTMTLKMQPSTDCLTNKISRKSMLKKVCAKENLFDYMVGDDHNVKEESLSKARPPALNKSLLNLTCLKSVMEQNNLCLKNLKEIQSSMTEVVVIPNKTSSDNLLTSLEAQKIMSAIVALSGDILEKANDNYVESKVTPDTSTHVVNPKSLLHLADWACHKPKFSSPTRVKQNSNDLGTPCALSKGDFGEIGQIVTDNPEPTSNITVRIVKGVSDDSESIDKSEASKETLIQRSLKNSSGGFVSMDIKKIETVMPSKASNFLNTESFSSCHTLTQKTMSIVSNDSLSATAKLGSGKISLGFQNTCDSSDSYFKILSDTSDAEKGKSVDEVSLTPMQDTGIIDTTTDASVAEQAKTYQDAFHASTKNIYDQKSCIALVQTGSPILAPNINTHESVYCPETLTVKPSTIPYETLYCPGTLTNLLTSFVPEEVISTPPDSERYISTITTKLDSALTESSNFATGGSYFTSSEMSKTDSENITSESTTSDTPDSAANAIASSDIEHSMGTDNISQPGTLSEKTLTTRNVKSSRTEIIKKAETPRYVDSANYFEPNPKVVLQQEVSVHPMIPPLYPISNSKTNPQSIDSGTFIRKEIMKDEINIKSSSEKSSTKPSRISLDKTAKNMCEKASKLPSETMTKFFSTVQAKSFMSQTNPHIKEQSITGKTSMKSSDTLVANTSRTRALKYTSLATRNSLVDESFIKSKTYSHKTENATTSDIDTSRDMKMSSTIDFNKIKRNQKEEDKCTSCSFKKEQDWQMVFDIIDMTIRKLEDNLVVRLTKELKVHIDGGRKLKETRVEMNTLVQAPDDRSRESENTVKESNQQPPKAPTFPASIQLQCNLLNTNEINDLMRKIEKKYDKKAQDQAGDHQYATKAALEEKSVEINIEEDSTAKDDTAQEKGIASKSASEQNFAEIIEREIQNRYDERTLNEDAQFKLPSPVMSPVQVNIDAAIKCRQYEPITISPSYLEDMSLEEVERDETSVYKNSPTSTKVCISCKSVPVLLKPLWFIKENWFVITWVPFFYIICMFVVYGAFAICVYLFG